mmetsp:Transcript_5972/g.16689  ORF Transcript_5972/g.16689 Transcript_5972/m.16689 type:complete len:216 (+) Transcript_5972:580-1227(+)
MEPSQAPLNSDMEKLEQCSAEMVAWWARHSVLGREGSAPWGVVGRLYTRMLPARLAAQQWLRGPPNMLRDTTRCMMPPPTWFPTTGSGALWDRKPKSALRLWSETHSVPASVLIPVAIRRSTDGSMARSQVLKSVTCECMSNGAWLPLAPGPVDMHSHRLRRQREDDTSHPAWPSMEWRPLNEGENRSAVTGFPLWSSESVVQQCFHVPFAVPAR